MPQEVQIGEITLTSETTNDEAQRMAVEAYTDREAVVIGDDRVTYREFGERIDALAAGLWKEMTLGRVEGVVDALTFLKETKRGDRTSIPKRVAVLSGGDCAMDASAAALDLGATDLYVVYGGSLSDMHWHLPDGWFRENGVHCMTLTQPLGYEVDAQDVLTGLKICRTDYEAPGGAGDRPLARVARTRHASRDAGLAS